jgi:hypothetical protein
MMISYEFLKVAILFGYLSLKNIYIRPHLIVTQY